MSEFEKLLGRTLAAFEGVSEGSERIELRCSDGAICILCHEHDCCESVEVAEIHGDITDLIGAPLLLAEEVGGGDCEPLEDAAAPSYAESYTWTFYKLATVKGHVTLRWLGMSNGYYSERVSVYFQEQQS